VRAVNLIPADQRRGAGGLAGRSGGVVYVLTGGLVVVVVMGVVYASAVHSVASHETQLASLTAQVQAVDAENQALQPYVQVASVSEQKVHEVTSLAEQRFNWPTAMAQLALALPNDVAFTSFTATVGAGASAPAAATTPTAPAAGSATTPTAPTSGPATGFALVGCANSQGEIPTVLTNLASVPGVTNVHLVSTVELPALRYHALSTRLNGGGSAAANEPAAATCPKVTFTLDLSYAATYTLPNSKAPTGSTGGAQTVSTSSGTGTAVGETASRHAGVTR
jgi:Tfp pilus assembly protein PilN